MKRCAIRLLAVCLCWMVFSVRPAHAQQLRYSEQLADRAITLWPDSFSLGNGPVKWSYDLGVILKGMEQVWLADGNAKWFAYMQRMMDYYVQDNGEISAYKASDYNIDFINNGKVLLTLYRVTGKKKYLLAVQRLRKQLLTHPRTSEGGFWHKKIYAHQLWLDGLYMAQPFYAEYAQVFGEDSIYRDVVRQFALIEKHTRDEKTGLLYHGWDESRQQRWANKETGASPNFWARSLGWYGMALVDALDYFPQDDVGRDTLVAILRRWAAGVDKVQFRNGLWYQVPDMPEREGNYPEASASAMMVYTLAKAVRKGYIEETYAKIADKGYKALLSQFIKRDAEGNLNLHGTVQVSGLGGEKNYRDGSFEYYMSEPVIANDPKGIGAFILCATEMEMRHTLKLGKGKRVLLDYYYNNEWKKDATGRNVRHHYTWEDRANGGYSLLGHLFNRHGASTDSLAEKPVKAKLNHADIYIIVDPDTEKESPNPHFLETEEIETIKDWVNRGGVLVLLGNDFGNAEFDHFNRLASTFGITFNKDNELMVKANNFAQGTITIPRGNKVFKKPYPIYIKEISTLKLEKPAKPLLSHEGFHVMAVAKYGKGTVFALGDPWIYNEYLDGRKLPDTLKNYPATCDWVKWLLKQVK